MLPVGFAANLLQPVYLGKYFDNLNNEKAYSFFTDNFDNDTCKEIGKFIEEKEESVQKLITKCHDPITFWRLVSPFYPKLSAVALKLFIIPESTAELESLFSCWPYVHNLYRNRLAFEKSTKMINIYYSIKHCKKKLYDLIIKE